MGVSVKVGCILTIFALVAGKAPPEKCEKSWKKVGCFHDRIIPNRPYPFELVNHRDPLNSNWDKHIIDWKEWPQSLHALACKCAQKTRESKYQFFGLQFYGECWSGPNLEYNRDGFSKECIGETYKTCNKSDPGLCIGKAFTNFIYSVDNHGSSEGRPINGNWNEWSEWTECSKRCNGGSRFRERICDNPKPENGGAYCKGNGEESERCNMEPCEPICDKKLEIGIILDSSTSVTSGNWNRTKKFLIEFSKEFVVSEDGVHFGVIHFNWMAKLEFAISDKRYHNPAVFRKKVHSIEYAYGGTRTDKALRMASQRFFCATCGLRKGVPCVLIVLTDGKSNRKEETKKQAALLKEKNIDIITMGVDKSVDVRELKDIATSDKNVFLLDSYKYLNDKINSIHKASCKAKS